MQKLVPASVAQVLQQMLSMQVNTLLPLVISSIFPPKQRGILPFIGLRSQAKDLANDCIKPAFRRTIIILILILTTTIIIIKSDF